jgi:hypothetical protein
MSTLTSLATAQFDNVKAELCRETFRETFRGRKERFVVYFSEGEFEWTEGVFKTEEAAKVCYNNLVKSMAGGWRP